MLDTFTEYVFLSVYDIVDSAAPLNMQDYLDDLISQFSQQTEKKQEPIRNRGDKVGRNDPCPCGSGKKYKNCHMGSK